MKLKVIQYPNPILRQISLSIDVIDDKVKQLANDMIETMVNEGGVGLSAVQIGELVQLVVILRKPFKPSKSPKLVMINPKIVDSIGTIRNAEGCLSFGKLKKIKNRSKRIVVSYKDLEGKDQLSYFEDIEAIIVQHELDHLSGRLLVDKQ